MDSNIIIISGPSGAGKSSLCKELFKHIDNIYFSISSTTRKIRDGEVDGVHYHFIDEEKFLKGINDNYFLEWAKVHNNYYGTEKLQIQKALLENKIILFDIDIKGQIEIKKYYPNAISVFITTQNKAILQSRLKSRALDSKETIQNRLQLAYDEIKYINNFDFIIINNDFNASFEGFLSIVKSLKFKNNSNLSKEILNNWQK